MSDDLDDYSCDPGYCQLSEVSKQARENLARIEQADRAIANLQREYDKRGDSIEVLEQSVVRLEREVRWWEEDSATRIEALEREKAYLLDRVMEQDDLIEAAEAALAAMEQRLDATKDKAEAAILDLMAERDRAEARLAECEARLSKAVEALRFYSCDNSCDECPVLKRDRISCGWTARTTLAENGDTTDE